MGGDVDPVALAVPLRDGFDGPWVGLSREDVLVGVGLLDASNDVVARQ
jgi:hypothetical protein